MFRMALRRVMEQPPGDARFLTGYSPSPQLRKGPPMPMEHEIRRLRLTEGIIDAARAPIGAP